MAVSPPPLRAQALVLPQPSLYRRLAACGAIPNEAHMTIAQLAAVILIGWAPALVLAAFLKWREIKRYGDIVRHARSTLPAHPTVVALSRCSRE